MAKIDITARLNAATADGILANANQIYDENKGKFQTEVNEDLDKRLKEQDGRLERYHDDLVDEVNREVADTIETTQETIDQLKEASEWLKNDPSGAQAITEKTNQNTANIATIGRNTGLDEYSEFSTGMDYAAGDVVLYDGVLFRFKADHAKGEWDYNEVEEWSEKKEREEKIAELGQEVQYLNSEVKGSAVSSFITKGWTYSSLDIIIPKGATLNSIKILNGEFSSNIIYGEDSEGNKTNYYLDSFPYKTTSDIVKMTVGLINNATVKIGWALEDGGLLNDAKKLVLDLETKVNNLTDGSLIENPSITLNNGTFINNTGNIASAENYAYTNKFYVYEGEEIDVEAKGYLSSVSVISRVEEDNTYIPIVVSVDSYKRLYKYIVEESGYYAASFSTSESWNICVRKNTPQLLSERININKGIIYELNGKVSGASFSELSLSENRGKFIGVNGSIADSNGYAYTNQFYAEKGSIISVNAAGYMDYVTIIAKVVSEGTEYIPKVTSTDSSVRLYEYIVEESGYYAASFSTTKERKVSISTNTPNVLSKQISSLKEDVNVISKKLYGVSEIDLNPSIKEAGKFINNLGNVMSANGFAYSNSIKFAKGTTLVVNARGYLTNISIISKVVQEGTLYVPLVVSDGSTLKDYRCVIEEDGLYAFSWSTAQPFTAKAINFPKTDNSFVLQENLYYGIPEVGIIGDSLSSGAGTHPITGVNDYIEFAWWKVLERKSGMTYRRFCQGGMSTRNFFTNKTYGIESALTEGNQCKLYIIALEVNDRYSYGNDYLGSISDVDFANYENNKDSYYGNYAKIIQKITEFNPNCKFMLFTNPRTDGEFNNAIRELSSRFSNCYLVDLWEKYNRHFISNGYFSAMQDSTAHYPSIAYQSMAKLFEKAIDDCINDNLSDFLNIQY